MLAVGISKQLKSILNGGIIHLHMIIRTLWKGLIFFKITTSKCVLYPGYQTTRATDLPGNLDTVSAKMT